ncbi:hypothetical protein MASSI9I_100114 [Massilia sp. 9I]|nr:hypothetical protein MASSI9I_100114 [Massilia sp. 9I]
MPGFSFAWNSKLLCDSNKMYRAAVTFCH